MLPYAVVQRRSQVRSKWGKNKGVARKPLGERVIDVLTTF